MVMMMTKLQMVWFWRTRILIEECFKSPLDRIRNEMGGGHHHVYNPAEWGKGKKWKMKKMKRFGN